MFNNIVTIQKKDKITGEIIEEITAKNSQTLGSIQNYMAGSANSTNSLLVSYADTGSPRMYIQVQESDVENVVNEATSNPRDVSGTVHRTSQIVGINQPILTLDTVSKTVEFEFNGRLNPPTSGTRSIAGIQLGIGQSNGNRFAPGFAVILNTPCVQTDTEILDVFYRVRITGNPNYSNDYYWITYLPFKFCPDAFYDANGDQLTVHFSSDIPNIIGPSVFKTYGHPNSRDKMPLGYTGAETNSASTEGLSSFNLTQLTGVKDWSNSIDDEIGQTYNTLNFFTSRKAYYSPESQLGIVNDDPFNIYQFSHQILPDDVNPLQGQFLHSTTAIRPYLDPSFLGTGQGSITFNAPNWNEDESVVYRLLFTTGGDVGTAEYKLLKKIIFGYPENEYENEFWAGKYSSVLPSQYPNSTTLPVRQTRHKPDSFWVNGSTADFLHYEDSNFNNGALPNIVRYDEKRVICFDTSGISIVNIFTDDYFNIDSQSTPSLTTSAINDVTVNELNGEIWIATTDAGLFRISSDFTTVTPITVATGSITDSQCRSVDYKNNGDIWAAFTGGLASSTDNGSTWTEYNASTTPEFAFTGISDGNWGEIQGIVIDKDSADDRLLIAKQGTKVSGTIIWWSRAGSAVSSDAFDSTIPTNSQAGDGGPRNGEIHSNSQAFGVRKWIKYFPGTTGSFLLNNAYRQVGWYEAASTEFRTVDFGASAVRASLGVSVSSHDTPRTRFIAFEQDSSGNYGFLAHGTRSPDSSQFYKLDLLDVDLLELENWTSYDWGVKGIPGGTTFSGMSDRSFYIEYMKRGIAINSSATANLASVNRMVSDTGPFGDSTFTSIRDVMWEEYGWDGANWVLDNPNSKVVHGTQDTLIDNLEVQFADVGAPNFVLNEYVDINVFKGIHNDNATEFSYSIPVTVRASNILTDLGQATVPASPLGAVINKQLNFITNTGLSSTLSQLAYNVNGQIGQHTNNLTTNGVSYDDNLAGAYFSEIIFEGDFSISFRTGKDGRNSGTSFSSMGMLPLASKGSSTAYDDPNYLFQFSQQTYSVRSGNLGGNITHVGPTTISAKTDLYTFERIGTNLNMKINGSTVHTFSGVGTDAFVVQASFYNESARTFYDMNIDSYTENGYVVELGDGVSTGLSDARFAMIEAWLNPVTSSFTIAGADAPVGVDPHVAPVAGAATVYSKAGWVRFNSADAGSAITGEYQVLYGFN